MRVAVVPSASDQEYGSERQRQRQSLEHKSVGDPSCAIERMLQKQQEKRDQKQGQKCRRKWYKVRLAHCSGKFLEAAQEEQRVAELLLSAPVESLQNQHLQALLRLRLKQTKCFFGRMFAPCKLVGGLTRGAWREFVDDDVLRLESYFCKPPSY